MIKELTTQQKIDFCTYGILFYQSGQAMPKWDFRDYNSKPPYYYGFCHLLILHDYVSMADARPSSGWFAVLFPELWAKKPASAKRRERRANPYWFPITTEGAALRIAVLEKVLIKLDHKRVRETRQNAL